jgi:hypothetical protein
MKMNKYMFNTTSPNHASLIGISLFRIFVGSYQGDGATRSSSWDDCCPYNGLFLNGNRI